MHYALPVMDTVWLLCWGLAVVFVNVLGQGCV